MNDIQPYCPEIRFSDVDAYGIVHNAKYLVYMEQARIHWWRQAVGGSAWDWTKVGVLVAHHTIDYLSPVQLGDTLEVSCVAGDVGTKSMDVHYTMSCKGVLWPRPKRCSCASTTAKRGPLPCPKHGAMRSSASRRLQRRMTQT